jgi:NADH:ubiquinone oxidoreductase subunit 2 (subunit N)
MEGPTPSSAIFYGALSVHLGVFLLLRTQPVWESLVLSRCLVFIIGLLTVFMAHLSEKTQSNIKGQIAYASIAQVGFMFMELAIGLEALVLLHFLGNAFLRCYQLLVSPSIVAHLLRVEGAANMGFEVRKATFARSLPVPLREILPEVLENTLLVLSLQEFNLEVLVRDWLWEPMARAGKALNGISLRPKLWALALMLAVCGVGLETGLLQRTHLAMPLAVAMTLASLAAFGQKRHALRVWNLVGLSSVLAGLVAWATGGEAGHHGVMLFYSGIVPAWLLGIAALNSLLKGENAAGTPFLYRAMAERKPRLALLLFLSFLGLVSFPISPAFIAEDLLLFQVSIHYPWLIVLMVLAFVLNGIAAAAVFQRLCLGRPSEIREHGDEPATRAHATTAVLQGDSRFG